MQALSLLLGVAAAAVTPNEILDATSLMKLGNTTENGKVYTIEHGDHLKIKVLHVWGSPAEMGKAQGRLLAHDISSFFNTLPAFFKSQASQIPLGDLPKWLQTLIENAAGDLLPGAVNEALKYVLWRERKFLEESQSKPLDEMKGLAEGYCEVLGCDATAFTKKVETVNMIPELIRMSCTMFGAWGSATPTGTLTQLRALDFGSGPFANYSIMTVYHPTGGEPFATIGFPGFAGAVTAFSGRIAISEKVWDVYTGHNKGHYDGLPVTGVIRDMAQFANTKEEAVAFAMNHTRTWAVFLGVGDAASQEFTAMAYREADLNAYSPGNISEITGFQPLQDVVMIDKHPQPTHDNHTMPETMAEYHGKITGELTAQYIPAILGTGDLHVAIWDFGLRKLWASFGWIDSEGNYGPDGLVGQAHNQPYLEFSMDALFNEKL